MKGSTYALSLEMGSTVAVHMLVEVLELQPVELIRDGLDRFVLAIGNGLNSWSIPVLALVYPYRHFPTSPMESHHLM